MASKDYEDPIAESKYPGKGPLFIQRRPLEKDELKELIRTVSNTNKEFRSQHEIWETMSDAFSQRVEISIARIKARIQKAKEKAEDSTSVAPEKTLESEDSTSPFIGDEKAAAKLCYKKWNDDLKKTIEEQRQKTRNCAEEWIGYLHRFDYKEEQVKPLNPLLEWSDSFCQGLVIVLCLVFTILSFSPEVTMKWEEDFLSRFYEKVFKFLVGARKLYLTFHNITI